MRLISKTTAQIGGKTFLVKTYRDSEWGEYICRLFVDGLEMPNSSYHTDDKLDAIETASKMLGFYRMRAELIIDGSI